MTEARPPAWASALYGARALYGALLLTAPRRAVSALAGEPADDATLRVARVLGGRQIAQAALLSRRFTRAAQLAGAGVDAMHSASMVALGRWAGQQVHRRLARRDAVIAATLAATGVAAAAGCRPARPG